MSEWKVENIATLANGKKAKDISPAALYPIYGGNGIMGYTNSYNASNVVIIGRVGAYCGSVHYSKERCWISDNAISAMAKDKNSTEYLYYLLSSLNLNRHHIGGAQPLMTQGIINNIDIPKHFLSEQKKIAAILSSLDEKIETNRKINMRLEELAQALFKSWFIDFEPFGGKMPDDWKTSNLGSVCNCILGGTPNRANPEFWNGDISWINSGEVNKLRIFEPSEYITKLGLEKSATKLLPKKTVVLAITGATLGQVSLLEIETCANQSVVGVLETLQVPHTYLYPFIKHYISELVNLQTGGAQQHINKQNVESLSILLPSKEVIEQFDQSIRSVFDKIASLCFESSRLSTLRDTLLPKLMSGELIPE